MLLEAVLAVATGKRYRRRTPRSRRNGFSWRAPHQVLLEEIEGLLTLLFRIVV